jgi:hypothetical protein
MPHLLTANRIHFAEKCSSTSGYAGAARHQEILGGHFGGDVEDDGKAHIGNPAALLEQAGDEARGDPHDCDGQNKPED